VSLVQKVTDLVNFFSEKGHFFFFLSMVLCMKGKEDFLAFFTCDFTSVVFETFTALLFGDSVLQIF
jgi:hypothetical protein